jgi:hypothetical protein
MQSHLQGIQVALGQESPGFDGNFNARHIASNDACPNSTRPAQSGQIGGKPIREIHHRRCDPLLREPGTQFDPDRGIKMRLEEATIPSFSAEPLSE